jgi:hypothetical protein
MNLFNVEIVAMFEKKLYEGFPLSFSTFEIYSAPGRVNGQLWP